VLPIGSQSLNEESDEDCDLSERDIGEDIIINPIELQEAELVNYHYNEKSD
jgi:hypothetical protein